ncbi:MAG: hypothetical protein KatS3mg084_0075 [Candidatus Dojkabacteria bacterium]|nr:MAG: hypothetical protein KatS3mg084_0075 [Candidatus Dojkabacteria bacterium]
MSRSKVIKDNLLLLIGGNLGNVFSFLIHMLLLRLDPLIANMYIAYNGIVLILGVPALVVMRMLTVYGHSIIVRLRSFYTRHQISSHVFLICILLALIPLTFIIQQMTFDRSFFTAFMLVILAITTFVAYAFRGLKQHEENFLPTIISLNIETGGRLLLVYIFGFIFGWGINGVLFGAIISMIVSVVPVFEFRSIELKGINANIEPYRFSKAFISSLIVTACIEFFSNFDIVYSMHVLQYDLNAQTQYNILQIFRKIIFYGIFISSGLILAIGGKNKHGKRFTFFYTAVSSFIIGFVSSIVLYLGKDVLLIILNNNLNLIDSLQLISFLFFTTLMSSSYLLSNWLLSQKKLFHIVIPILAIISQIVLYIQADNHINDLLNAYYLSTSLFFIMTIGAGLWESLTNKNVTI